MILIRKVKDSFGWLGNMSPYAVEHEGVRFRTTEALFQSLRFAPGEQRDLIRSQNNPMVAKMIAKKHRSLMIVTPLSEDDLQNMRLCLRLKIGQHPDLCKKLLATEQRVIIEDCTRRQRGSGLFWGAALKNDQWIGENWLGQLWMELRAELLESQGTSRANRRQ